MKYTTGGRIGIICLEMLTVSDNQIKVLLWIYCDPWRGDKIDEENLHMYVLSILLQSAFNQYG